MRKKLTWLFMFLELCLGIILIISGLVKYFVEPSVSEKCAEATLCATDTLSFFTLWIYLTIGVMLICLWYMTSWRAYRYKAKGVKLKLKPEDFVK